MAESFGYDPLQSTGREWYYFPVDELFYQEYNDKEVTSLGYLASSRLNIRVIDACSPEENKEPQEDDHHEDRAMAWKRLRPSALRTVCKSMHIGALISLIAAAAIGLIYMLFSYVSYKTKLKCQLQPYKSIPIEVQWMKTISSVILGAIFYIWFFVSMLFLFRPYQLMGVKRKLFLVCCLGYFLDSLYRLVLQALGISYSKISTLLKTPLNVLFLISVCWQAYLMTNHLCLQSSRRKVILFLQITVPSWSFSILALTVAYFIYPVYNKLHEQEAKMIIALFAPLIGVVLKAISRICVQRLWNIIHPGYLHVLLAPLYSASAVMFRVLQTDLDSLQSTAILGIIHGAAEVRERIIMVVIDRICHVIWKRTSAPWGSFRTPRRERLMADIAIMSMLYESTAIMAVNGFLYLYQLVYSQNNSLIKLLQSFAIHTSVPLVIEWFFTSVSLAIETHYQNMAVMAVWQRQWKRHILVAIVNVVPLALWTSTNLVQIVRGRFNERNQPCKMSLSNSEF